MQEKIHFRNSTRVTYVMFF